MGMATAQDSNSDLEGCGCKKLGALTNGINAIHTGAGCHAAVTSYMLSGGKSSAGGIFFAKLKGSCSAQKPVVCSTDTAFDGGNRKWMGRCQTLDECRDSCEAPGCVAFNWWPGRGGCRHYATADYTKRKTAHVTIGGTPDCASDVAGPTDEMCSSQLLQADSKAKGGECSTDTAFDGGNRKWMGRCQTLDECRDSCEAPGCVAFNWWPGRGGCRHYATADYTKRKT